MRFSPKAARAPATAAEAIPALASLFSAATSAADEATSAGARLRSSTHFSSTAVVMVDDMVAALKKGGRGRGEGGGGDAGGGDGGGREEGQCVSCSLV
jgi:hypothetical protein